MGVTPSYLSRIESDARTPSAEHIELLSNILGLEHTHVMLRAGIIPNHMLTDIQANPERFHSLFRD